MKRKDLRLETEEEKEKIYDHIRTLFLQGEPIKLQVHKSGFPAVTVDCYNIHITSDWSNIEAWWLMKIQQRR